jgi:hypothetical protein
VILVDQSRDYGFSAGGSQVGHVADWLGFNVRGPLPPALVRPVGVVVFCVPSDRQGQVALIEDQGPVQQLAVEGSDLRPPAAPHQPR